MSIGKWNFYFAQLLALDFCCRHKNFNGGTSVCHLHWGLECSGIQHVMRAVWMGAPNQAASLQGYLGVSSATQLPWQLMTRAPAQAGNRASRTEHYLQWWENCPEWNTETSAADKRHNSSLHYVKARSGTQIAWSTRD